MSSNVSRGQLHEHAGRVPFASVAIFDVATFQDTVPTSP